MFLRVQLDDSNQMLQIHLHSIEDQMARLHTFEEIQRIHDTDKPISVTTYYGEVTEESMCTALNTMGVDGESSFLDFGCGPGRWLAVAHALGAGHVAGVEFVKSRVDIARHVLGDTVRLFEGDGTRNEVWDAVSPTHVVFYNRVSRELRAFYAAVNRCKTIQKVLLWKTTDRLRGFRCENTMRTATPAGETFTAYLYVRSSPSHNQSRAMQ